MNYNNENPLMGLGTIGTPHGEARSQIETPSIIDSVKSLSQSIFEMRELEFATERILEKLDSPGILGVKSEDGSDFKKQSQDRSMPSCPSFAQTVEFLNEAVVGSHSNIMHNLRQILEIIG